MADLTVDYNYVDANRNRVALKLTNAEVAFKGSLIGLSVTTGYAVSWADTAALEFMGIATTGVTGDTSATPPKEVEVDCTGVIIKRINVTGTSAITHVGDLVYASTDNPADFTLTGTANTDPIAIVTRWYSSATCDVMLLTPAEHRFI